ncbi:MAG: hypothetical protein ABH878_02585 [bacterium]
MSHALRTTLILGAFWLLVILGGTYFVHFRLKDDEEKLRKRESQVGEELRMTEELVGNIPMIHEELTKSKRLWEQRSKEIPRLETAHQTYNYLDEILSKKRTELNFDYTAGDKGDTNGVHSANYLISGEASFADLYNFIWYIEHLPRYIRINAMQLMETTIEEEGVAIPKSLVKFDMFVTALSADRPGFEEVQFASNVLPPSTGFDPFKPRIQRITQLPPNTLGLPEVFKCTLRALTPVQIYIVDQLGELKSLRVGDEVYLGTLADIVPDENRAVFKLDKMYPPQEYTLEIKVKK